MVFDQPEPFLLFRGEPCSILFLFCKPVIEPPVHCLGERLKPVGFADGKADKGDDIGQEPLGACFFHLRSFQALICLPEEIRGEEVGRLFYGLSKPLDLFVGEAASAIGFAVDHLEGCDLVLVVLYELFKGIHECPGLVLCLGIVSCKGYCVFAHGIYHLFVSFFDVTKGVPQRGFVKGGAGCFC